MITTSAKFELSVVIFTAAIICSQISRKTCLDSGQTPRNGVYSLPEELGIEVIVYWRQQPNRKVLDTECQFARR